MLDILIVEDNKEIGGLLETFLRKENYIDAWYRLEDDIDGLVDCASVRLHEVQANSFKNCLIRAIGKAMKCVAWPVLAGINEFHKQVLKVFFSLRSYLDKDRKRMKEMEKEIEDLKQQVEMLKKSK